MNTIQRAGHRLWNENRWEDMEVQLQRGPAIIDYLESINRVMHNALNDHHRTLVIRFDLHFPKEIEVEEKGVISKFFSSLKAKMAADSKRKTAILPRVHPTNLRYIWVREKKISKSAHFHVAIFLNAHAYNCLGSFSVLHSLDGGIAPNMFCRISQAWASALGLTVHEVEGLVHIPDKPKYLLNFHSKDFTKDFMRVFWRLSYMAKLDTKDFDSGFRCFGRSRD